MLYECDLEILTTTLLQSLSLLKSDNILNYVQINSWVNVTLFQSLILLSINEVEDLLAEPMMSPDKQLFNNQLWNISRE